MKTTQFQEEALVPHGNYPQTGCHPLTESNLLQRFLLVCFFFSNGLIDAKYYKLRQNANAFSCPLSSLLYLK